MTRVTPSVPFATLSSRSVVAIGEFSRRRRGNSRDSDEDEDDDDDDDDDEDEDDDEVEMHGSYYDR